MDTSINFQRKENLNLSYFRSEFQPNIFSCIFYFFMYNCRRTFINEKKKLIQLVMIENPLKITSTLFSCKSTHFGKIRNSTTSANLLFRYFFTCPSILNLFMEFFYISQSLVYYFHDDFPFFFVPFVRIC